MTLVVFGGLPGVGKSTVARLLAVRLRAVYVRIDTIEQAMRACGMAPVTEGYAVGYRVAEDNLRAGGVVVADSVNPLAVTRDAWVGVAERVGVPVVEVEVVCSDLAEHRHRVESRVTDVAGLVLPMWEQVQQRAWERWDRPHLVLDTASRSPAEAVELVLGVLAG
jgi:predicted kinase